MSTLPSRRMKRLLGFLCITLASFEIGGQTPPQAPAQPRTILAIGAHAGDMELTAGQLLIHQHRKGDRIVILHMTLGEGGNPKLDTVAYGAQKRREAIAADSVIGAEAIFAPYRDGELPNDEAVRRYVADVIRQVRPVSIITHWKKSFHKDHANTSAIVQDAILLAALPGVVTRNPAHRGVRGIWYADNWEDAEDFQPFIYVDVSEERDRWREAVTKYEFVRGGISSFRYLEYYDALAVVRGAVSGKQRAVAFDIDAFGKRRVLDAVP